MIAADFDVAAGLLADVVVGPVGREVASVVADPVIVELVVVVLTGRVPFKVAQIFAGIAAKVCNSAGVQDDEFVVFWVGTIDRQLGMKTASWEAWAQ